MPPVTIYLPPALRARAGNRRQITAHGSTVREVINALDTLCPGMGFHLLYETGDLRPFVNVFLERENVRYLQGLDTAVTPGSTLHIVHSVAGG